jgi:hypothetical protein
MRRRRDRPVGITAHVGRDVVVAIVSHVEEGIIWRNLGSILWTRRVPTTRRKVNERRSARIPFDGYDIAGGIPESKETRCVGVRHRDVYAVKLGLDYGDIERSGTSEASSSQLARDTLPRTARPRVHHVLGAGSSDQRGKDAQAEQEPGSK